jgi:hypothetical protein
VVIFAASKIFPAQTIHPKLGFWVLFFRPTSFSLGKVLLKKVAKFGCSLFSFPF